MTTQPPSPPPPSSPPPEPTPPPVAPSPPATATSKQALWILLGAAAVLVLLLPFCCCGGVVFFRTSLDGPGGVDSQLVGTWKGPHSVMGSGWTTEIEFKPSGRFDLLWTGQSIGMDSNHSGRWQVRDIEGDKQILEVYYDREPNKAVGWTVVISDPDQINLSLETTHSFNLQRQ